MDGYFIFLDIFFFFFPKFYLWLSLKTPFKDLKAYRKLKNDYTHLFHRGASQSLFKHYFQPAKRWLVRFWMEKALLLLSAIAVPKLAWYGLHRDCGLGWSRFGEPGSRRLMWFTSQLPCCLTKWRRFSDCLTYYFFSIVLFFSKWLVAAI